MQQPQVAMEQAAPQPRGPQEGNGDPTPFGSAPLRQLIQQAGTRLGERILLLNELEQVIAFYEEAGGVISPQLRELLIGDVILPIIR